jgi:enoyl-CoA hydratase
MAEPFVRVEQHGRTQVVTIDRPQVFNALNGAVLAQIGAAVADAPAAGARCIVITGSGPKAFSAGADLEEFAGLDAAEAHARLEAGQAVMRQVESSSIPVLAAVNGVALGGGFELVLACAFPVVATNASFGLPETGLGLIPGFGGTQRLPRTLAAATARYLILTGDRLSADRAHQLGLTPVPPVAPEELLPTALEIADRIRRKAPEAQSAVLRALRTSGATATGLALEAALGAVATSGPEAAEGIAAFRAKRTPAFASDEAVDS